MQDLYQAIAVYIAKYLKNDIEGQVELGIWVYQFEPKHPVVETIKEVVLEMIAENMIVLTSQAHADLYSTTWAKLLRSGELIRGVMHFVAKHSSVVTYLPSRSELRKRADSGVEI